VSRGPLTHILPHLPPSLSVPLAAVLLDYSIGYVPESESDLGLATTPDSFPMHFFECILTFCDGYEKLGEQRIVHRDLKSCTIMKFSCPVAKDASLQPEKLVNHLDELFSKRLKSIGDPTLLSVEICHTTHILDRLAF
jgi:hypothetical protein